MVNINVANSEPIFTISTAAKLLQISVHTLRMYEREGLIIPFQKKSKQRLYSKADIERLECVRKAINEAKISINGIKMLYSLIPCWQIINCSAKNRKICTAYNHHSEPCWLSNHPNTICSKMECRECEVYTSFGNCSSIKEKIKAITAV
jgi:MerR family transcriptional regulator/heat shock protein HspR